MMRMMAMVAAASTVVPVLRSMVAAAAAVSVMMIVATAALLCPPALSRLSILTRDGILELMATTGATGSVLLTLNCAFAHHLNEFDFKGKSLTRKRMVVVEVHDAVFDLDAGHLDLLAISRTQHDGMPYGHLLPVWHHAAGNLLYEVTTPFPISLSGLEAHGATLALLHLKNSSIEAGDHLTGADREINGLAALVAIVELRSVIERAHVMNPHLLPNVSHAPTFPIPTMRSRWSRPRILMHPFHITKNGHLNRGDFRDKTRDKGKSGHSATF